MYTVQAFMPDSDRDVEEAPVLIEVQVLHQQQKYKIQCNAMAKSII